MIQTSTCLIRSKTAPRRPKAGDERALIMTSKLAINEHSANSNDDEINTCDERAHIKILDHRALFSFDRRWHLDLQLTSAHLIRSKITSRLQINEHSSDSIDNDGRQEQASSNGQENSFRLILLHISLENVQDVCVYVRRKCAHPLTGCGRLAYEQENMSEWLSYSPHQKCVESVHICRNAEDACLFLGFRIILAYPDDQKGARKCLIRVGELEMFKRLPYTTRSRKSVAYVIMPMRRCYWKQISFF